MKDPENSPLVSIITVVYNGEKYIENTIKSVINQSYKNIEYIIIDGKSTDGTVDIIRKYEEKIGFWISEKDNGIYNAMNKGIMYAKGEIIGIINSDDWFEVNAIEKIVSYYNKNKSVDVFHGMIRNCDENENTLSVNGVSSRVLDKDSLPHPATFITAKAYKEFGNYNEEYKYVADYELFLRYRNKNAIFLFIEEILANFRLGGFTTHSNKFLYEKFQVQKNYGIISFIKQQVLSKALSLRNLLLN